MTSPPAHRLRVLAMLLAMITMTGSRPVHAEEPSQPKVDEAVERGLAFLAKQQNEDGSFDGGGPRTAMTGLVILAYLASGHTPDLGRYGLSVRRAVDFLVRQVPDDGYIGRVDASRMYGQAIATTALAEVLGVESGEVNRRRTQAALMRLVKVIEAAQDMPKDALNAGGWRFEPTSTDSDLPLSSLNLLALRAASRAGIEISKDRIDRAAGYIRRSYQMGQEMTSTMTALALLNPCPPEFAERPDFKAAMRFFGQSVAEEHMRYPYGTLYCMAQAAHQRGEPLRADVWPLAARKLLDVQMQNDGGWPTSRDTAEPGRVYATSLAVLTLSLPHQLLPLYQK